MPRIQKLLLSFVVALVPAVAWSQVAPPPPALPPMGGASDLSRINRESDALTNRTAALATLIVGYRSTGELTSALEKTNPQSLFVRIEVNGLAVKSLARGKKQKVQTGVEPGDMEVQARWTRPGTKAQTECLAQLRVGVQEILFLPYGGADGFSCQVVDPLLDEEAVGAWTESFEDDQMVAFEECEAAFEKGGDDFWACIDVAGLPLPIG